MGVVGEWTVHYRFSTMSNYALAELKINDDGTAMNKMIDFPHTTYPGVWVQVNGMITCHFYYALQNEVCSYAGTISRSTITGLMFATTGLTPQAHGDFYAEQKRFETTEMVELDTLGNKVKNK